MAVPVPFSRLRQGPMAAALALIGMGALVVATGLSQPAWIGARVGPGLMMQGAGLGIIALAGLWLALRWGRAADAPQASAVAAPLGGVLLLGSVLAFALLLPVTGLVIAATVAAALAGLGAGERSPLALLVTALSLGALTAAIGLTLLPPTAPLWPGR